MFLSSTENRGACPSFCTCSWGCTCLCCTNFPAGWQTWKIHGKNRAGLASTDSPIALMQSWPISMYLSSKDCKTVFDGRFENLTPFIQKCVIKSLWWNKMIVAGDYADKAVNIGFDNTSLDVIETDIIAQLTASNVWAMKWALKLWSWLVTMQPTHTAFLESNKIEKRFSSLRLGLYGMAMLQIWRNSRCFLKTWWFQKEINTLTF